MFDRVKNWFRPKDEDVLKSIIATLNTGKISTRFIKNQDGLIVAHALCLTYGDKVAIAEPVYLDWPFQELPRPDAFKQKELN